MAESDLASDVAALRASELEIDLLRARKHADLIGETMIVCLLDMALIALAGVAKRLAAA